MEMFSDVIISVNMTCISRVVQLALDWAWNDLIDKICPILCSPILPFFPIVISNALPIYYCVLLLRFFHFLTSVSGVTIVVHFLLLVYCVQINSFFFIFSFSFFYFSQWLVRLVFHPLWVPHYSALTTSFLCPLCLCIHWRPLRRLVSPYRCLLLVLFFTWLKIQKKAWQMFTADFVRVRLIDQQQPTIGSDY